MTLSWKFLIVFGIMTSLYTIAGGVFFQPALCKMSNGGPLYTIIGIILVVLLVFGVAIKLYLDYLANRSE